MLNVQTIVCNTLEENAYIITAPGHPGLLLVDPGDDLPSLSRAISEANLPVEAIALTHGHFDHILGAAPIRASFGSEVFVHQADLPMLSSESACLYDPASCSRAFEPVTACVYGETFTFASCEFQVLSTPGHTPGSVCLYCAQEKLLFSGDTLFRAGFGRTDFAGGSASALRRSLRSLFSLPEDTLVFPGHGPSTTIGQERRRYFL